MPRTRVDDPRRRFFCTEQGCERVFCTYLGLRQHLSTHEPNPRYKCNWEACKFVGITAQNLQTHIDGYHLKERRFKCNECPKTFITSSGLSLHRDTVHLGKRLHCTWPGCDRSYSQGYNLRLHIRKKHQGINTPTKSQAAAAAAANSNNANSNNNAAPPAPPAQPPPPPPPVKNFQRHAYPTFKF